MLLVLILIQGALLAQNISVKSFRLLPDDLTARVDPVTNDNGQTCALVKIVTTERGFEFDPDALGMCGSVDESHAGEVWIWLSPSARCITIRHKNLGVLRGFEYPVTIESACTYEMVLVTGHVTTLVEEQNKANYVTLTVFPPEAIVKIDGSLVVLNQGQFSKRYPVGQHRYEAFCDLYHPLSGTFQIEPNNTTNIQLSLQPNYGYIKVTSEPMSGATVFIDGRTVGTTPYTSGKMPSGTHTVQAAKDMYKDVTKQVTVSENQTTEVTLTLAPNFAEPVFTCADKEAEIWVNGECKGIGQWRGKLSAGDYLVEARKVSHHTSIHQLTLATGDNRSVTLDAPTPITGKIDVSSTPFGADILLDGHEVGTTPRILNQVLVGTHELRLEKTGCAPLTCTVTVEEGKTVELSMALVTGLTVILNSEPTGADIYVDDTHVGTAPCSATLSFGIHRVKAEKECVVKEETVTVSEQGQTEWTLSVQKVPQTQTIIVNGVSFKMVAVEGGTFMMGCTTEQGNDCYADERPMHQVTVNDFYIGETEVTQALWKAVVGKNPSCFKGDDRPVENVKWDDVQKFIRKLNQKTGKQFRLPTETEWEYAARGGNQSKGYKYSGSNTNINDVAWYSRNSGSITHSVKMKNANELGLYDMSGNVWEWCQDGYSNYSSKPQTNPTGYPNSSSHVLRGGSCHCETRDCRISFRNGSGTPSYRNEYSGFRIVLIQ